MVGGPHPDDEDEEHPDLLRDSLDFNADGGLVRASHDGAVVVECSGNLVRVIRDDGWETRYYHLANTSVRTGDRVAVGDVLGQTGTGLGCGGRADGPHVHFTLFFRGIAQDTTGIAIGGWQVQTGLNSYDGCLTRHGIETCATWGHVLNDGAVGVVPPIDDDLVLPTVTTACPVPKELGLTALVNERRVSVGLPPLQIGRRIEAAARDHVELNAKAGAFDSLFLPSGEGWNEHLLAFGELHAMATAGYNGGRYAEPEALIADLISDGWFNTWALHPDARSVGVGYVSIPGDENENYWIIYIGARADVEPLDCQGVESATATSTLESTTGETTVDPAAVRGQSVVYRALEVAQAGSRDCASPIPYEMVDLINQERRNRGQTPLVMTTSLFHAAQDHTDAAIGVGTIEYSSLPDGTNWEDNLRRNGYDGNGKAGVWVGYGSDYASPVEAFAALMDSSFTQQVFEPDMTAIGVGFSSAPLTGAPYLWSIYVTQGPGEEFDACATADPIPTEATIDRIVDAATIRLRVAGEGLTISLIGVDGSTESDLVNCLGEDVTAEMAALLTSGAVTVEIIPKAEGERGRISAYVWVERQGERILINDLLLREGWALSGPIPNGSPYVARLVSAVAFGADQLGERCA